jgi:NAD(P)-dependent dehydrogenase (short-subunit alcohol dehydrogenase family)
MHSESPSGGLNLGGRRVIVTGAASGIGRAVAERFAAMGSRVCLADINLPGAAEVAGSLGSAHHALPLDLADPESCAALVAGASQRMGGLDILVNAGAIILRQPLDDVTPADIHRMVDVNMAGAFFLARTAAGIMRRGSGGRIILLSSQGAHTGGYVGSTVYAMTKAAVISLVKSLARELASSNITVNAIAPGVVDTPMIRRDVSEAALSEFMKMVPLGRIAAPREIADCCLFLASDWASYVTGHTLDVNGGQLMR